MLKRIVMLLLIGLSTGVLAGMWFGPGVTAWRYKPAFTSAVNICEGQINEATKQLVWFQLTLGVSTAVLFAGSGYFLARRRARALAAAAAAPVAETKPVA